MNIYIYIFEDIDSVHLLTVRYGFTIGKGISF